MWTTAQRAHAHHEGEGDAAALPTLVAQRAELASEGGAESSWTIYEYDESTMPPRATL